MRNEDILDMPELAKDKYLSPYKLGLCMGAINAVICLTGFVLPQKWGYGMPIVFSIAIGLSLLSMVAICFLGNPNTMFWNIFKTGFAYLELTIAIFYIAALALSTIKNLSMPIDAMLWPVYCQILLLPLLVLSFIFWLFPGHLVHYRNFMRNLKQKSYKAPYQELDK